jgi:hypothetical protein
VTLQRDGFFLYTICVRAQLIAKFGETITPGMAFENVATECLFQPGKASVHSGLIDPQRFRSRERASRARHGQEISQVVPIEHAASYAFLPANRASLLLPEGRCRC